ncbi:MAG: hypothetical protein QOF49_171, partial [Chloroflexota bacterium]|nr:hypothetical protein [Chloroflexota bacterium]
MSRTEEFVTSAAGVAVATVAMSAVMVAGDRMGLMGEQPPTAVTRAALGGVGADDPPGTADLIAPVAHLGFGATAGVVYGLTRRLFPRVPGVALGPMFGLGVWAVSYKGWIPALGILPQPDDDRPDRPTVMVVAHVVYGVVLGWLVGPR